MSTLYNLEPQPTAKVLLRTTSGEILLELFAKQTPLASRNFLQLCLDNYYDHTTFHRLVPHFIVQGGDPTGTGSGGESSYDGQPFADEFHSRLRFNRRGLLGMANTGSKDDNGSQFFITLENAEELNGRNTMFGRVVGDTVYNLMKMAEAELVNAESERPLYPTKILGTEILVNPFDDMVRRISPTLTVIGRKQEKQKLKRKSGKQLLSFGEGELDETTMPVAKRPKFNPKLVVSGQEYLLTVSTPAQPMVASPEAARPVGNGHEDDPAVISKKSTVNGVDIKASGMSVEQRPPESSNRRPSPSREPVCETNGAEVYRPRLPSFDAKPEEGTTSLLEKTNAQIAALKASMQRHITRTPVDPPRQRSALEAMVPEHSIRGRKRKVAGANSSTAEEKRALDMFNAFKSKLDRASAAIPPFASRGREQALNPREGLDGVNTTSEVESSEGESALCDLHFIANCQSCDEWSAEPGFGSAKLGGTAEGGGMSWMSHSLTFAKDRLGKDLEWKRKNEEELTVIDPREKARDLMLEARSRKETAPTGLV